MVVRGTQRRSEAHFAFAMQAMDGVNRHTRKSLRKRTALLRIANKKVILVIATRVASSSCQSHKQEQWQQPEVS